MEADVDDFVAFTVLPFRWGFEFRFPKFRYFSDFDNMRVGLQFIFGRLRVISSDIHFFLFFNFFYFWFFIL